MKNSYLSKLIINTVLINPKSLQGIDKHQDQGSNFISLLFSAASGKGKDFD